MSEVKYSPELTEKLNLAHQAITALQQDKQKKSKEQLKEEINATSSILADAAKLVE